MSSFPHLRSLLFAAATAGVLAFLWSRAHPPVFAFEVAVTSSVPATPRLFARVASPEHEATVPGPELPGGKTPILCRFGLAAGRYRGFRLEPISGGGTAVLARASVTGPGGSVIRTFQPAEFRPNAAVTRSTVEGDAVRLFAAWDARHPGYELPLAEPLLLEDSAAAGLLRNGSRFALLLALLCGAGAAFSRLPPRVRRWLSPGEESARTLPCKGITPRMPWWQWAIVAITVAAGWLINIDLPEPANLSLDASWQAALVDAHLHGRHFGTEVVFTYGPWGWLQSHFFLGDALATKRLWELCGRLLWFVGLAVISRPMPAVRRTCFLAAAAWCGSWFADSLWAVGVILGTLHWLMDRATPRWLLVLVLAVFAFLAETKFTFTLLAGAGVALAAASLLWRGWRRRAAETVLVFMLCFLVWWLAAGQSLASLPAWVLASWEIASTYPQAMAIEESTACFLVGLSVAGIAVIAVWRRATPRIDRREAWPAALFLAGAWFLAWKHGYTRADGHMLHFLLVSLLLFIALPGLFMGVLSPRWTCLGLLLCLAGISLTSPGLLSSSGQVARSRLYDGWRMLTAPAEIRSRFADIPRSLPPSLRAAVGSASVDLTGAMQSLVLEPGIRYQPRPVFQSYSAYSLALQERNLDFFRSARAPGCVLLRIDIVDGRHPMQDDSLALESLPELYKLSAFDGDLALLRRRSPPLAAAEATQLGARRSVALGKEVPMPSVGNASIRLRASARPSLLGRLRGVLYKPSALYLVSSTADGRRVRHRLVPAVLESGFIISPHIESTADYVTWMQGKPGLRVTAISFEPDRPQDSLLWSEITVELSSVPNLSPE